MRITLPAIFFFKDSLGYSKAVSTGYKMGKIFLKIRKKPKINYINFLPHNCFKDAISIILLLNASFPPTLLRSVTSKKIFFLRSLTIYPSYVFQVNIENKIRTAAFFIMYDKYIHEYSKPTIYNILALYTLYGQNR